MPRFFFNIADHERLVKDPEGQELSIWLKQSLRQGWQRAILSWRLFSATSLLTGGNWKLQMSRTPSLRFLKRETSSRHLMGDNCRC